MLQRAHVVPADADLRPSEWRPLLLLLMICHQKDSQRAFSLTPSFQMGKLRPEKIRLIRRVTLTGFCVTGSRSCAVHNLLGCTWWPWPGCPGHSHGQVLRRAGGAAGEEVLAVPEG